MPPCVDYYVINYDTEGLQFIIEGNDESGDLVRDARNTLKGSRTFYNGTVFNSQTHITFSILTDGIFTLIGYRVYVSNANHVKVTYGDSIIQNVSIILIDNELKGCS